MSQESALWLNTNVLIGFADRRGPAWHQDLELQAQLGLEPNHYAGPIPLADIERRLFNFTAEELGDAALRPLTPDQALSLPTGAPVCYIGDQAFLVIVDPGSKKIVASDNDHIFKTFSDGYHPHQYKDWLYDAVANIIGGDLQVGSAALLRERGIAFLSIELADHVATVHGFDIDPILFATTSFTGQVATTYGECQTAPICDNTFRWAQIEARKSGKQVKIRHTSGSNARIGEVRDALGLVLSGAETAASVISTLVDVKVTKSQWRKTLDLLVPVPAEKGRSQSIAQGKQDRLQALFTKDVRVAPWTGTAFGVLQAFNTFRTHEATVKNVTRVERNFLDVISGATFDEDVKTLEALESVVGTIDLSKSQPAARKLVGA